LGFNASATTVMRNYFRWAVCRLLFVHHGFLRPKNLFVGLPSHFGYSSAPEGTSVPEVDFFI